MCQDRWGKYSFDLFPISGLLTFILAFFFCTEKQEFDEELDRPYDPNDKVGTGSLDVKDIKKLESVKMSASQTGAGKPKEDPGAFEMGKV